MSLIAADIVTDLDILALDGRATADFGTGNAQLGDKRRIAVMDWLRPRLEQAGLPAHRHLTHRTPAHAFQYTGGSYTDQVDALGNVSLDDLDFNDVFVTAATDALYVGARDPFRGLYVGMIDSVNVTSAVAAVCYWNGAWTPPSSLADHTVLSTGKSFSGSGQITWSLPDDWARRRVNDEAAYWMRLTMSARPSDETRVGQVLPLAYSRLTYPTALYTLGLLYSEGWANTRGDWQAKSREYLQQAEVVLDRVLPLIGDEFDIDATEAVDPLEVNSLTQLYPIGWNTWERG